MRAKPKLWVLKTTPGTEFEAFAWRTQPFLFAVLRKYCGGMEADLEDLVHDVLLRTLLRWEQLRGLEEAALRGWLARVAHNCFLDRCRRKSSEASRMESLLHVHEQSEQDDGAWEPELWEFITPEDLMAAIAQLRNPKERRAFELHLHGLSYSEIGREMGARPGTVGAWLTRARGGLRELLRVTAENRQGALAR